MRRLRQLPRLLHQRSHYGYTDRPSQALRQEPEAVSADEQRKLTRRAKDNGKAREQERARGACDAIDAALTQLDATHTVDSNVRAMRRQLAQLRRRLQL